MDLNTTFLKIAKVDADIARIKKNNFTDEEKEKAQAITKDFYKNFDSCAFWQNINNIIKQ